MASEFGKNIKVSIFGQSHSAAIGAVIDGLPAGEEIDMAALRAFMARRAPSGKAYTTMRKEADEPEILSGLLETDRSGILRTCGAPLAFLIRNKDTRSSDYDNLKRAPRPGHSDFTAFFKYQGFNDIRGGGHFSGRLTAPLVFAGAAARQILERRGILVGAHIAEIAGIADHPYQQLGESREQLLLAGTKEFPVNDDAAGAMMQEQIQAAKMELDSVGGVIECMATGLPVGLGAPMFDGVENRLAAVLFGIPAVKGVEFGEGFHAARLLGSQNNDGYRVGENGRITAGSNHAGGILGGITSGMPLLLRAAIKPTSSIAKEQNTVDLLSRKEEKLVVHGRHDPCIVPRAVPCVEAATAVVLLDLLMDSGAF